VPAHPSRWTRLWRHITVDRRHVHRAFPATDLAKIEIAIADSEKRHSGQVCFAIEAALPPARVWAGVTPRERALEVFGLLRVWDTEHNDGVLIYVTLADRDVEIVADRGIHAKVGPDGWEAICRTMEDAFRAGRFTVGALAGIAAVAEHLELHAPRGAGDRNELSDKPVLL